MNPAWTAAALADLRAIHAYLAASSLDAAARTVQELTARARQASLFPHSGRAVSGLGSELIRELIERPYRIIYEVFPDRVDILAVVHGARQFPE